MFFNIGKSSSIGLHACIFLVNTEIVRIIRAIVVVMFSRTPYFKTTPVRFIYSPIGLAELRPMDLSCLSKCTSFWGRLAHVHVWVPCEMRICSPVLVGFFFPPKSWLLVSLVLHEWNTPQKTKFETRINKNIDSPCNSPKLPPFDCESRRITLTCSTRQRQQYLPLRWSTARDLLGSLGILNIVKEKQGKPVRFSALLQSTI